jgi:hypothetical protein
MGYFDALTIGSFKTARDGRRSFFPWGVLGRGYVIGLEPDYERLRYVIKAYIIVAMALIISSLALLGYLAGLVVGALIVFYAAWTRYLLRGLQPSEERLSLQESMNSQARAQSPSLLWIGEIASIVFVATGILILVFNPGDWLIGTASIVFFGLCAVFIMYMLVLRRRGPSEQSQ